MLECVVFSLPLLSVAEDKFVLFMLFTQMSASIYHWMPMQRLYIRSGEITKENAHKSVHALDIQSLMNIFAFNEEKNNYTRVD